MPSTYFQCNARGLGKLAAAMANKGTIGDCCAMNEETWELMHADKDCSEMFRDWNFISCQGGVFHYDKAALMEHRGGKLSKSEEIFIDGRDGFYGWQGSGGSSCNWNPDLKIGIGYVPNDLHMIDEFYLRPARLTKCVVECAKKCGATVQ